MKSQYILISVLTLLLVSCGGSKNVIQEKPTSIANTVEIVTPCSGEKFSSNKRFFRGSASAVSRDENTARRKAVIAANLNLAGDIQSFTGNLSEEYTNEVQINDAITFQEEFESFTESRVKQEVSNAKTICDRLLRDKTTGFYTAYVTREVGVDNYFSKLTEEISQDEKLKLEYKKEKFKEAYEKSLDRR